MRLAGEIDRIFDSGHFFGKNRAHGRVTVEPYWQLNVTADAIGTSTRGPYRWWKRQDNSQLEIEVPNLKQIDIDRTVAQDVASCNIQMINQWHNLNSGTPALAEQLGDPGHFWFERGKNPSAGERWDHTESMGAYDKDGNHLPDFSWKNVLVPNALLRTYQGWGGYDLDNNPLPISEAVDAGNLLCTGVWLIDTVTASTDGFLSISCRDIGRLLLEQFVFPPLAPLDHYPVHYYPAGDSKFSSVWGPQHRWDTQANTSPGHRTRVPIGYYQSSVDRIAVLGTGEGGWNDSVTNTRDGIQMHYDAVLPVTIDGVSNLKGSNIVSDASPATFAVSTGNQYSSSPSAYDFWEFIVNPTAGSFGGSSTAHKVDEVDIVAWGGGYECYISVYSGSAWYTNGLGNIPYESTVVGADTQADIPYVMKVNIPTADLGSERMMKYNLPQAYTATRVRLTLAKPMDSGVGTYPFRSGLRVVSVFNSEPTSTRPVVPNVSGLAVDPYTYAMARHPVHGYWLCDSSGNVYGYGEATDAHIDVDFPVSGMSALPQGNGFYVLEQDGTVHAVGDAQHYGNYIIPGYSIPNPPFSNGEWAAPVNKATDIAVNYNGTGYWVCYGDGTILAFGDAAIPGVPDAQAGNGAWYGAVGISGPEASAGVVQRIVLPGTPVVTWCEIQMKSPITGRGHWDHLRATGVVGHPHQNGFWVTNGHGEYFAFGASKLFDRINQNDPNGPYAGGNPAWGDGVTIPYGGLWQRTFNKGRSNGFVAGGFATSIECTENGDGLWILFGSGQIGQFGTAIGLGPVRFYPSTDPKIAVPAAGLTQGSLYSTLPPHLQFFGAITWGLVRAPGGIATASGTAAATTPKGTGFWVLTAAGGVGSYNAKFWGSPSSTGMTGYRWHEGNYEDYVDIVKEFLMWGGWWEYDPSPPMEKAEPYGVFEKTGVFSDTELKMDKWDKKSLMDGIKLLRQVVNYLFYIDEEGAAHFESSNFWRAGNFDPSGERIWVVYDIENADGSLSPRRVTPTVSRDAAGQVVYTFGPGDEAAVPYIPELNERTNLTSYSVTADFSTMRSQIIVGATQPNYWDHSDLTYGAADSAGGFQIFEPPAGNVSLYDDVDVPALRGITRPSMLVNRRFTNAEEQKTMIELLQLHSWFAQRVGSAQAPANPCLSINDQIKIVERQTGDTYIHYVRGMKTSHEVTQGKYTMALETNWLGTAENWVVQSEGAAGGIYDPLEYALVSDNVYNWALRTERGAIGEIAGNTTVSGSLNIAFEPGVIAKNQDWLASGTMRIKAPGLTNVKIKTINISDWMLPAVISVDGSLFDLPAEGQTLNLGDIIVGSDTEYEVEITGQNPSGFFGTAAMSLRMTADGMSSSTTGDTLVITSSGTGELSGVPVPPDGSDWGEDGTLVDDGDRTMPEVTMAQLEDDITQAHDFGSFPYTPDNDNRFKFGPTVSYLDWPGVPYNEMIILGDSLSALGFTAGNLSGTDRWCDAVLDSGVINSFQNGAIMGQTTVSMRDLIDNNDPFPPQPQSTDVFVVFFGANDINTSVSSLGFDVITPAIYQANLEWFLDNYPADRQIVIYPWEWSYSGVAGVPVSNSLYLQYRDAARAAADKKGASFIDLGSLASDPTPYQFDGIHCNAAGVTFIADLVESELRHPGGEYQPGDPGDVFMGDGWWGSVINYHLATAEGTAFEPREAMVQVLSMGGGALVDLGDGLQWYMSSTPNSDFTVEGRTWGANRAGVFQPVNIEGSGMDPTEVYGWSSTGPNGKQFGQMSTNADGTPSLIHAYGRTPIIPNGGLDPALVEGFMWWVVARVVGVDETMAALSEYKMIPGAEFMLTGQLAPSGDRGLVGRGRELTAEWQVLTGHTCTMAQLEAHPPLGLPGFVVPDVETQEGRTAINGDTIHLLDNSSDLDATGGGNVVFAPFVESGGTFYYQGAQWNYPSPPIDGMVLTGLRVEGVTLNGTWDAELIPFVVLVDPDSLTGPAAGFGTAYYAGTINESADWAAQAQAGCIATVSASTPVSTAPVDIVLTVDQSSELGVTWPAEPFLLIGIQGTTVSSAPAVSANITFDAIYWIWAPGEAPPPNPSDPPVISSLTPTTGSTGGGTSVTITGSGFTGATSVTFGNVEASSFSVVSDSTITASTPVGSAGPVNVAVTGPGGTDTSVDGFAYVAPVIPVITSITPDTGSNLGGEYVTISGSGFTGASSVTFGADAATFDILSDGAIQALTPAHAAGLVTVTVTNSGGDDTVGFTYEEMIAEGNELESHAWTDFVGLPHPY